MNDKFFEELKEKIQHYFDVSGGHEFDHTQRVYNISLSISKGEDVDMDVVKAAALIHDIVRAKEDSGEIECHAKKGAELAKEILSKTDFPKDKIDKVCEAIRVHRYSKGLKAKTKEAEILQDADRLDALGAVMIGRVFSRAGKRNRKLYVQSDIPEKVYKGKDSTAINHFYEKILKLKTETFKTKKAREIAKERYEFTEKFVKKFIEEWEGKDLK